MSSGNDEIYIMPDSDFGNTNPMDASGGYLSEKRNKELKEHIRELANAISEGVDREYTSTFFETLEEVRTENDFVTCEERVRNAREAFFNGLESSDAINEDDVSTLRIVALKLCDSYLGQRFADQIDAVKAVANSLTSNPSIHSLSEVADMARDIKSGGISEHVQPAFSGGQIIGYKAKNTSLLFNVTSLAYDKSQPLFVHIHPKNKEKCQRLVRKLRDAGFTVRTSDTESDKRYNEKQRPVRKLMSLAHSKRSALEREEEFETDQISPLTALYLYNDLTGVNSVSDADKEKALKNMTAAERLDALAFLYDAGEMEALAKLYLKCPSCQESFYTASQIPAQEEQELAKAGGKLYSLLEALGALSGKKAEELYSKLNEVQKDSIFLYLESLDELDPTSSILKMVFKGMSEEEKKEKFQQQLNLPGGLILIEEQGQNNNMIFYLFDALSSNTKEEVLNELSVENMLGWGEKILDHFPADEGELTSEQSNAFYGAFFQYLNKEVKQTQFWRHVFKEELLGSESKPFSRFDMLFNQYASQADKLGLIFGKLENKVNEEEVNMDYEDLKYVASVYESLEPGAKKSLSRDLLKGVEYEKVIVPFLKAIEWFCRRPVENAAIRQFYKGLNTEQRDRVFEIFYKREPEFALEYTPNQSWNQMYDFVEEKASENVKQKMWDDYLSQGTGYGNSV